MGIEDIPGKMKAYVAEKYGEPAAVMQWKEDVPVPLPNQGEILVKVKATSANPGDWHLAKADPFLIRLMFGMFKPTRGILGSDVVGTVVKIGEGVTDFKVGDEVAGNTGDPDKGRGFGAFAEYCCDSAAFFAKRPENVKVLDAAGMPMAATTALQALRDYAHVKEGQSVLIIGAGGGIGSYAVQLAKHMGAKVTGVCGKYNADRVKALGATTVIDYNTTDYTALDERFDAIIDVSGKKTVMQCLRVATPAGIHVNVGGDGFFTNLFQSLWVKMAMKKKATLCMQDCNGKDVAYILKLMEEGKVFV